MKFEPLTSENHELWNRTCEKSSDAWFLHTTLSLDYQAAYRPDLRSTNLSFMMVDDSGAVVAACPLLLEQPTVDGRAVPEFSMGGSPLPHPAIVDGLAPRRRDEILKLAFEHIDALAREHQVARATFRITPLCENAASLGVSNCNFLMKYGYLDRSILTQIILVSNDIESLKKDIRKGHWSDIKRGEKLFEIDLFDRNTITDSVFLEYQRLHAKAAGRVTRPQSTFDSLLHRIRAGNGLLVRSRYEGSSVAFVLVTLYKQGAYFASAANDPEVVGLPVQHAMQWATLRWLHESGFRHYEIGWQHFDWQLHDFPSRKEIAISRYKRGFGGRTVPFYVGEKFYDQGHCAYVLGDRMKRYLSHFEQPLA